MEKSHGHENCILSSDLDNKSLQKTIAKNNFVITKYYVVESNQNPQEFTMCKWIIFSLSPSLHLFLLPSSSGMCAAWTTCWPASPSTRFRFPSVSSTYSSSPSSPSTSRRRSGAAGASPSSRWTPWPPGSSTSLLTSTQLPPTSVSNKRWLLCCKDHWVYTQRTVVMIYFLFSF